MDDEQKQKVLELFNTLLEIHAELITPYMFRDEGRILGLTLHADTLLPEAGLHFCEGQLCWKESNGRGDPAGEVPQGAGREGA